MNFKKGDFIIYNWGDRLFKIKEVVNNYITCSCFTYEEVILPIENARLATIEEVNELKLKRMLI